MSPILVMLLASVGPLLVGFTGLNDDDDGNEAEADVPEDSADDPVEIVDVATFIEDARSTDDNSSDVTASRGTDADEEFIAETDTSANHDASGGEDTITGSSLDDTLAGGDGSDVIEGGDGNDALYSAVARETRPDDEMADTLDGGAGDDTLFLGDGDTGTGGTGTDVFVATQDAVETIVITDFNVEEDAIGIETETPDDISIVEQLVEEGGLTIELSTGLIISLEGVTEEVPETSIQFISVSALADS